MAKTRFDDEQIRAILAEQAGGVPVSEIAEKHKISSATFYNWKARLGAEAPQAASAAPKRGRPKADKPEGSTPAPKANAADENSRLKVMLVDLMLEVDDLKRQLATR
jgi:transposase-like protein